jgi:hypothetical protein
VGKPILMPMDELLRFVRTAPGIVVANHLEALNHCSTTRGQLKKELKNNKLLSKVHIPYDGDVLTFEKIKGASAGWSHPVAIVEE